MFYDTVLETTFITFRKNGITSGNIDFSDNGMIDLSVRLGRKV